MSLFLPKLSFLRFGRDEDSVCLQLDEIEPDKNAHVK
uniref:Uncharacterized protein n=1 Tax=Cyprinus carpio TaxID=7962 RepID=A0A8C2JKS8_CYPCA